MINVLLIIILCYSGLANANDNVNQEAKAIANSVRPGLENGIKSGINLKGAGDVSIGEIINYNGTDLKEKTYSDHGARESALSVRRNGEDDVSDIVSSSFLRQKEFKIEKNSSLFDNAKQAQAHPERYVDWISGKYEDCKQEGGEALLSKEQQVCDEYTAIEERLCVVGRTIVVDAKHKYECTRSIDKVFKRCIRNLIVSLQEANNCSVAIVGHPVLAESIKVDGQYAYITVTTASSRGLGGDKVLGFGVFLIPNFGSVDEAVIEEITGPSAVEVKLGHALLFATHKALPKFDSTRDSKRAQTATLHSLNKDIKALLKPGWNVLSAHSIINTTVIIKLRITKRCIITEKDEWVESCTEVKGEL